MNYIKTYESYSNQEILDTISDILLDAKDEGLDADVEELTGTSSAWASSMSGYKEYRIIIQKNKGIRNLFFNYEDIRDVMDRSLQYLNINRIEHQPIQIYDGRWYPFDKEYDSWQQQASNYRVKAAKILFRLK